MVAYLLTYLQHYVSITIWPANCVSYNIGIVYGTKYLSNSRTGSNSWHSLVCCNINYQQVVFCLREFCCRRLISRWIFWFTSSLTHISGARYVVCRRRSGVVQRELVKRVSRQHSVRWQTLQRLISIPSSVSKRSHQQHVCVTSPAKTHRQQHDASKPSL